MDRGKRPGRRCIRISGSGVNCIGRRDPPVKGVVMRNTQKALTADGASGRTSSRANRQSDKRRRAACIVSRPLRFSTFSMQLPRSPGYFEVLSGPKRAGSTTSDQRPDAFLLQPLGDSETTQELVFASSTTY